MGEPEKIPESHEPQRSAPPEPQERLPISGLAIASLVLGVIGVPFSVIPLFGILGGVLAVIFGAIGISQVSRKQRRGMGIAIAGVVIGAIDLFIFLVVTSLIT